MRGSVSSGPVHGHTALGARLPHIFLAGSPEMMNLGVECSCMHEEEYVTHTFPKILLRAIRTFQSLPLLCFLFLCSSCVRACFSKAPIMSFLLLESRHAGVLPDSGSTARLVNNWKLLTYNNLALLTINDLVKTHTHTRTHHLTWRSWILNSLCLALAQLSLSQGEEGHSAPVWSYGNRSHISDDAPGRFLWGMSSVPGAAN